MKVMTWKSLALQDGAGWQCASRRSGRRRFHALVLALSLFVVAGCGMPAPPDVAVDAARIITPQWSEGGGKVLFAEVSIENRGDAAIHVFVDLLDVVGENGSRGSVREFRDHYRFDLAKARDAAQRESLTAAFDEAGIKAAQVRRLFEPQLEILPGETLRVALPFLLREDKADARYVMHFTYHDEATDRIRRERAPFHL